MESMSNDDLKSVISNLLNIIDYISVSNSNLPLRAEKQIADARAIVSISDSDDQFPQPGPQTGRRPCGECHLNVGENCVICGAVQHAPGSDEWLKQSPQFHPGDIA